MFYIRPSCPRLHSESRFSASILYWHSSIIFYFGNFFCFVWRLSHMLHEHNTEEASFEFTAGAPLVGRNLSGETYRIGHHWSNCAVLWPPRRRVRLIAAEKNNDWRAANSATNTQNLLENAPIRLPDYDTGIMQKMNKEICRDMACPMPILKIQSRWEYEINWPRKVGVCFVCVLVSTPETSLCLWPAAFAITIKKNYSLALTLNHLHIHSIDYIRPSRCAFL